MRINTVPEGYHTRDGRQVYSLLFTLQCPPPKSLQLIVPLDPTGNSRNGRTRAAEWGQRIVDVRPGHTIRFKHKKFIVTAVEAYRWSKQGINAS